ncbi:Response regulator receiver domain-containing protein [Enhydrobacter aerosaccus]|uniref:Response regulator receiver domain-containing protein n=1 Tax=Enhydrobacter aerosaccus TaxID=225324 RepID=A0A1T4SYF4_9HYPH|nr:response regulator [Enhydrobacter aerosaccus]SKA33286.1 Response regulator receiver domain-containing protein [Enhydrobacter aerosaccus]
MASLVHPRLIGKRVLIVEDNYLIATHLEQIVRDAGGWPVGPVSNIDRALKLLRWGKVDVALLDCWLSGGHAGPIAELLWFRRTPFVVVTGCDTFDLPPALRDVQFVPKPFSGSDVVGGLAQAIGRQL